MRVLVTGGAGFIGSHFVKRLVAAGDDVVVLDRLTYSGNRTNLNGVEHAFVHGDIADPAAVAAAGAGCDALVNFAADTHVDRSILAAGDFIRTDVLGTHVLLEWARHAGVRFIQVSTDEVYGDVEPGVSSEEDDPLRPSSPYAASKAGGDLQVLAYSRTYAIDACITRGANTYGPISIPRSSFRSSSRMRWTASRSRSTATDARPGTGFTLTTICAAIELVLREGGVGEVYNIGAGAERENIHVARRILELTGADPALLRHVADRPGHDRRYALTCNKLAALGWAPQCDFDKALPDTVAWYRNNRAWWEPIKSGEYRENYKRQYADRLRA